MGIKIEREDDKVDTEEDVGEEHDDEEADRGAVRRGTGGE